MHQTDPSNIATDNLATAARSRQQGQEQRCFFSSKTFAAIFVVCGSLVFAVVMTDLTVFWLLDIKAPGYQSSRFFVSHPSAGYFHKPGISGFWYNYTSGQKTHIAINRHGFADIEREITKRRSRIALVGDSVTEFWEVPAEQRGHILMEKLLANEFEVLNMGVRGYGTAHSAAIFESIGAAFDPDIVIYTFCVNDINNNYFWQLSKHTTATNPEDSGRNSGSSPKRTDLRLDWRKLDKWLYTYSYCFRKLKQFKGLYFPDMPALDDHFELSPYKKAYNEVDSMRLAITNEQIAKFSKYLHAQGRRFLVVEGVYKPVLLPEMQMKLIRTYGEVFDFKKVTNLLREACDENGVPFLSLPERLSAKNLSVNAVMHFEDTMHFNTKGSVFFATEVVEKLRSLGWLDTANGLSDAIGEERYFEQDGR